mmetsp:Transcript_98266/g.278261  ORF Transcript_98266/g.278261 Transcript_98266/m.278261 type:complete len:230 (+) Transcript_98266:560-1249(+)
MPSLKGSSVSTSSSSASPPRVIIWYISLSFMEITEKPSMNSSKRVCLSTSSWRRDSSRVACAASYSASRPLCSASARRNSSMEVRFGFRLLAFCSSVSIRASASARTTRSRSFSPRSAPMACRASSRPFGSAAASAATTAAAWTCASRSSRRKSRGSCWYSLRASSSLPAQAWIRAYRSRRALAFSSISFTRSTSWLFMVLAAWMTSSRFLRRPTSSKSLAAKLSFSWL